MKFAMFEIALVVAACGAVGAYLCRRLVHPKDVSEAPLTPNEMWVIRYVDNEATKQGLMTFSAVVRRVKDKMKTQKAKPTNDVVSMAAYELMQKLKMPDAQTSYYLGLISALYNKM
jgi:hypothetical protein